jgi:hypothetical protein
MVFITAPSRLVEVMMPDEKTPPTANKNFDKNMGKLVKDDGFGTMKNTSGTTTAEPKTQPKKP